MTKTLNYDWNNIMQRVEEIYGPDWNYTDIPPYLRKKFEAKERHENREAEEARLREEDRIRNLGY